MKYYFIFDVESIGLHGEGYAVAGGIYNESGESLKEFEISCLPSRGRGYPEDYVWVSENCARLDPISEDPLNVRSRFWELWTDSKEQYPGIVMMAECLWPVEAGFVEACIQDDPVNRNWGGPYPFHEIASVMLAAGMDPMATYDRLENELPAHHPLHDARQSARLFFQAKKILETWIPDKVSMKLLSE